MFHLPVDNGRGSFPHTRLQITATFPPRITIVLPRFLFHLVDFGFSPVVAAGFSLSSLLAYFAFWALWPFPKWAIDETYRTLIPASASHFSLWTR
jgi:hypothetical protein